MSYVPPTLPPPQEVLRERKRPDDSERPIEKQEGLSCVGGESHECSSSLPAPPGSSRSSWVSRHGGRLLVVLLIVGVAVFAVVDSQCCGVIKAQIESLKDFVRTQPAQGAFLLALVYALCVVAFVPGAPLTLAAGAILGAAWGSLWGIVLGSLSVFGGGYVGAVGAFLLGRGGGALLCCVLQLCRYTYAKVLDRVFTSTSSGAPSSSPSVSPLKLLVLLRLSPLMPFSAFNYICGGLPVSMADYLISTLFILPGTVVFVSVGALASSSDSASTGFIALAIGLPFLLLALLLMGRAAKRELGRVIEEEPEEEAETA